MVCFFWCFFLYCDLTNNVEAFQFSFSSLALSSLGLVAASSIAKYTLYLRSCRNNFQKFGREGVSRTEECLLLAFWAFSLMVLHHPEVVSVSSLLSWLQKLDQLKICCLIFHIKHEDEVVCLCTIATGCP